VADYREFAKKINLEDITAIPMSALRGDNITEQSEHMPWYRGTTLMGYLETVEIDEARQQKLPFRMPVQWVNRPNLDFRGFAGCIASGQIHPETASASCPAGA
jgi:bifunctional enzyme CysN/CysC